MTKDFLQMVVRQIHWLAFNRGLPDKIALYLHNLESPAQKVLEPVVQGLREQQYRFLTISDYAKAPEGRCAMITFDDNFRTWHDALPWLKKLDLPATFYVNTLPFRDRASREVIEDYYTRIGHTGDRIPLSTSELCALADAGHEIGAHSHSHFNLAALPEREAHEEIRRNKEELEQIIGRPVLHFAYPSGMRRYFTPALAAYCHEIGFQTVAAGIPGLLHHPFQDGLINRSPIKEGRSYTYLMRCLKVNGQCFERLTGRSAVG